MKKFYTFFAVVIVLNVIMLFMGIKPDEISSKKAPIKVGLVFDVGGRGDKSFNDSAYNGIQRAIKELGAEAQYFEPGEGSDRESSMRRLASRDFDLIIGVGFIFTDDITKLAKEYPDKKFAGVDYFLPDPPPNVAALKFREEEGSFLVGALAALKTKTNKIGFVGGMDIPLIHKFEEGYKMGAKLANPNIEVVSNYAGVTGAAFKDPAKGKELALSQYGNNVDIIFHASGSTGLGVFEAARSLNKLAIGVDGDQYSEAPGFILSSMVKKVDVAVFEIIKDTMNNKFKGGVKEFGLKQDGVGFVYDEHNKNLIPDDIYKKVNDLRTKIINGEIKVTL
jgi:basic membrane protein A